MKKTVKKSAITRAAVRKSVVKDLSVASRAGGVKGGLNGCLKSAKSTGTR